MSKIIKISILLPLFFFFGFFGCEREHINRNLYTLASVYLESSQSKDWNISIWIVANFEETIQLSMIRNNTNMLFAATNPQFLPNAFNPKNKIKSFSLKTIPQDLQLIDLFVTKDGKNIEDFIKDVNTDFGDNYGDTIYQHEAFYLKKLPLSLQNKDFRIVFSVITEEGKNFSDTTAIIHFK